MSDSQVTTTPGLHRDPFLESMVCLANSGSVTMEVTLLTHGFLVSGCVTGGREYFQTLAADVAPSVSNPEDAGVLSKAIGAWSEGYEAYALDSDEDTPAVGHVRLRDARFFHPGGKAVPAISGVLWRGRLEEISGFGPGRLISA